MGSVDKVWLEGLDIKAEDFDMGTYQKLRARRSEHNRKRNAIYDRKARIAAWEKTIPKRYRGYDIDNDEHWGNIIQRIGKHGESQVFDYLEAPTCFAILQGDNGLGKSILSVLIARELVGDEVVKTVELVTGTDILQEFSTFDAFARDGAKNPVDKYSDCDLLILDDVAGDNEYLSPTQVQKLSTVLESRYRNERLTILSTNMALRGKVGRNGSGAGLPDYFTPRIWSRISDSETTIIFRGESMRGR